MRLFVKQGSATSRINRRGILQIKDGMRKGAVGWLEAAREVAAMEVGELVKD